MARTAWLAVAGLAASWWLAAPRAAQAHATYNISGYGAGIDGTTNGADGLPTSPVPPAIWTNGGVAEYTGALPVNWYCGLHAATQVRTIQTGVGASPPSGSLLQQIVAYNTANDPDLPTDRVIGVGGLSWTDPDNGNQGWGHGLDYGLIHVTPLDTILAGGPVKLTVTLTDDPSDGVAPKFAYALYGGWDTSTTAERHQTFTTNPSPVNNPLGSSGLTLIDFQVATSAGQTLSRSYDVDATYGGKYTLFVGALGGVKGQYQLTAGLAPVGVSAQCDADLAQCETDLATADADLAQCQADLGTATGDADADGVGDTRDLCPGTAAGAPVDRDGCSRAQFCGALDVSERTGQRLCQLLDWQNDEPGMRKKVERDCMLDKGPRKTPPALWRCVPTPDVPTP